MNPQTSLQLPLFKDDTFDKVKQHYSLTEYVKLQKTAEKLKHQVAGFKGYRTKRKKNKK